jgi:hypothetical protein
MISYTLFDIALDLANSPTATEKTWLKRVRSLPAKGTWVAPNVAQIPNMNDWVMDSNTADIVIFWIHGKGHTAHADVQHTINQTSNCYLPYRRWLGFRFRYHVRSGPYPIGKAADKRAQKKCATIFPRVR